MAGAPRIPRLDRLEDGGVFAHDTVPEVHARAVTQESRLHDGEQRLGDDPEQPVAGGLEEDVMEGPIDLEDEAEVNVIQGGGDRGTQPRQLRLRAANRG